MTEKEQLIENIILSELQYKEKEASLLTLTDEVEIDNLKKSMARDREIVSTWCKNYDISLSEIQEQRERVLNDKIISVAIYTKEGKAQAQKEFDDRVEKLTDEMENQNKLIEELKSSDVIFNI